MGEEHMKAVRTAELSRKHDEDSDKASREPELVTGGTVKAVTGGLTRLVCNTKGGLTYTFT